jgi:endonuclease G
MLDLNKINQALTRIQDRDAELGRELHRRLDLRSKDIALAGDKRSRALAEFNAKTIVLRSGRPVLAVSHDAAKLVFKDAESAVWRARLQQARKMLVNAIRAVGRIELKGHPNLDWVGTGWLVAPDIMVTNRHVAQEFARAGGDAFVFRAGVHGTPMQAGIDFLEEFQRADDRTYAIHKILFIEDEAGADIAFLQIKGKNLATPIPLFSTAPQAEQQVAVIGYPARDSRIPDLQLMEQIFGDVYDKKRLAPGQVDRADDRAVLHDCSTLGGCSGSPVIDLASGAAVGIHFAGRFLEANFAAPASVIAERLHAVTSGKPMRSHAQPISPATPQPIKQNKTTLSIPIRVTIEIEQPAGGRVHVIAASLNTSDEDAFATEGRAEEYLDRNGYQPDFLGKDNRVPLPAVKRDKRNVLTFNFAGDPRAFELKYEHFSVVMHRARRLCFFSAVNIDGGASKRSKRAGWLLDPRIPTAAQIKGECYGNPPMFSRGHMTRREDPVWGPDDAAARANTDSMHVTNTVPQMQAFNAPVWLGLEDYALQHARRDAMKICVFTGPVLKGDDPVMFGVQIPRVCWKVIAFVHEQTGRLCATGYSISQEKYLKPDEFVFGAFETHQRPLRWIEGETGLSFGTLTKADGFKASEGVNAGDAPLQDFSQIVFV